MLYLTDLWPSDKFGSMEEQIFELARAFSGAGGMLLPVFGGVPEAKVTERYRADGLMVDGLNLHVFRWSSLFHLVALIRKHKLGVAHWNFYSPINPYVWMLSVLVPRMTHVRTDHTSRTLPLTQPVTGAKRFLKSVLFRRYRKVLCISDFVVDCLRHQGGWSNLSRCTYFINTERFQPRFDVRQQMRGKFEADEKFIVLLVANLIKEKGGDVAIRALAHLPEPIELWIVGDGRDQARLVDLADELSLSHRVRFLGNQRNVEPFMQAADCLACPSVWGEATGLVNLEALACGLPVVASDIGGIPEFVDDHRNGLLFTPGNDGELANRIRRLFDEPLLARRLSQQARLDAVEKFSIERRIPEYAKAYGH